MNTGPIALALSLAFAIGIAPALAQTAGQSGKPAGPAATVTGVAPTPWVQASALEFEPKVIEWRRHIHQHPELGNFETATAAYVASHLRSLGLEVHTGIARTGAPRHV